jgi:hypothetical protein
MVDLPAPAGATTLTAEEMIMAKHVDQNEVTYWENTREEAESSIAREMARRGGSLVQSDIAITASGNYLVHLTYTTTAAFRGKKGYVEHVVDVPQESGEENYNIWTDDNHVAGSFSTVAQARAWAKKEGVKLRAKVRIRRAADEGFPVPGRRGAIEAGQHLGGQP